MAEYQSEQQLENELVTRLVGLGYSRVRITDLESLRNNLKRQLEKHNAAVLDGGRLSPDEYRRVLNHLGKGGVFDKAKILRDRMLLRRDDGSTAYLRFLNTTHWCQNEYQVTHQVSAEGAYKNRYDVTLLINGLPLIQIELKRRGLELSEAFSQINRYQRHSYWSEDGLFNHVQLFVISNGVNTKYYANNRHQSFKQTFYWADSSNEQVRALCDFADVFLEKCHVSKMICRYIVLHESDRILMVLRPYQYHAVEAIVDRVKTGRRHGYVWHTTGSGKTLTSFKAAQVLLDIPKVDKVIFVVDRADLDYQTTREFNHFSAGSVDGTDNTKALVDQLSGETRLIVTTIQKLNTAISRDRYESAMQDVRKARLVLIFDECHRSQFGDTHKRITKHFTSAQMFGFTGTPIFADNAVRNAHGRRTTANLFDSCLHRYVITNAVADDNVLRFAVEYWGRLKGRDGSLIDQEVHSINKREFFENEDRIKAIAQWIIANHGRKTHSRAFTGMPCVGSVDALLKYYEAFKQLEKDGAHDLRVVTVFSTTDNEEDPEADGLIGDPTFVIDASNLTNTHSRDRLNACIDDYNTMFGTHYSAKDSAGFYAYYKDVGRRIKEREKRAAREEDRVDLLIVVNMFLTGFDAKKVNTLYVDKSLRHHGLIQAFSRTNRTLGKLKSHGNIVAFRNLKERTDEAIALFSNANAKERILLEPYEVYVEQFNAAVGALKGVAPTVEAVDSLTSEKVQLAFIRAFRQVMRLRNVLVGFSEYDPLQLAMSPQDFEDYKSKYLDLHDRVKARQEASVSILDDVDFELELLRRDEINVDYILELLVDLGNEPDDKTKTAEKTKAVLDLLAGEPKLRSKRALVERFINEQMQAIPPGETVRTHFSAFWKRERAAALRQFCVDERLDEQAVVTAIDEFHFTGREPRRETIGSALLEQPKILERRKVFERVTSRLLDFIQTFDEDDGGEQ
jgi:type I restriction enzyme, R subunit